MSKSLVVWTLGAIAIGVLLLFGFRDGADAATWKLVNNITLDCGGADGNEVTTADNSCAAGTSKSLGSTADLGSQFKVEQGHTNYNKVDTMVSSPSFNVALDSSIPNGAFVGNLTTTATLSLLNGPCVSGIPVAIPLFDANTDVTNTIDWVGDGSNWTADTDGNGLADAIDQYPLALNKVYNSQRPLARYFGYTSVQPGAPPSQLNMMIFPPGVVAGTTTARGLPLPEQELNSSVGYVTMIQLDNPDPTAAGSVSTITDFCTPLDVTARLFGKTQGEGRSIPATGNAEVSSQCSGAGVGADNDGDTVADDGCIVVNDACGNGVDNDGDTKKDEYCVGTTGLYAARSRVTNPTSATSGIYGSGTHIVGAYSQGNRDADADGIENGLDSCPTTADGRESGAACTPGNVADEDGDTKINDGCPRIGAPETFPSPDQCSDAVDQDGDTLANDGCPAVQLDGDADGLGTACDPTPAGFDTDPDGDLFLNRQDNCPTTANPDQLDTDSNRCSGSANDDPADDTRANDGCPQVGAAKETLCTDTTDNDGDTFVNDGCPLQGGISEFCVASDYGTCGDSMGNLCDANPLTPDGDFDKDFPRSAVCIGAADADSDGWCDATETLLGSSTASATSVPEYKGLDYPMPVSGTPGNCSNMLWYASAGDPIGDGAVVDDDGDTLANAADAGCGVIAGDADQDGVVDASDNCSAVYNPDQTNSDTAAIGGGDALGDACDPNDDGDGLIDTAEWARGSDAKNPFSPFMLDIDGNGSVQGADASALKAWIGTSISAVPAPSQVCLP
jgi:hypothetical protein